MNSIARLSASGFLLCLSISAADVTGIWTGQIIGRNNENLDVAFQFKPGKNVLFGDEFDLPVQDLNVAADHISFSVTSINYYDGHKLKFIYTGNVTDRKMELTRERADADPNVDPAKRAESKQIFTLRKL